MLADSSKWLYNWVALNMVNGISGFTANHQHQFVRDQSIQLNGIEVDPAQLREPEGDRVLAQPLVFDNEPISEAPFAPEMADPLTRLRALILATLTGQDLVSPIATEQQKSFDSPGAIIQSDTTPAVLEHDEVFTLKVREQESSQLSLWVSLYVDGEAIEGGFSYQLARKNQWEQSLTLGGLRAFIDPLVLNFAGPLRLSDERTAFDLNADGEVEMIARFDSDSFALARDLNANGRIDDGTEVIGALSGNGFAELAQWDENADGLITAEDTVWQDLLLWQPGLAGMQTLGSMGVSAIGLDHISSPFTFTHPSGETLGRVTATGYFVAGNAVRVAQQIDLAV